MLQVERDGRVYHTVVMYKPVKPARTAVRCGNCQHIYMQSLATGQPDYCPACFVNPSALARAYRNAFSNNRG